MRILQVVHGFAPECRGGTESYVLEATAALRAAGHDVAVLAGSPEPRTPATLSAAEVDGIPVVRLHRAGLFLDGWEKSYDPDAALLFERVLRDVGPDVVHVHHWIRLTRNLVEIAAAKGVPAVVTLHDAAASCPRVFRVRDEELCERPLSAASCVDCVPRPAWLGDAECAEEIEAYRRDFERELRLAAAIVVPSRAHQAFLSRELGLPASAFRVVPHGALRRGAPQPAASRPAGPRLRLGHWGHLEPYKGYHLLLEAVRLLPAAERRRVEVVCFGIAPDGEYRRRLDRLGQGLSITDVGAFSPADLGSRQIDVAVIPSLASESFSFVLDEAFTLGIPALVSGRGALAERLSGAGATFEPGSAASLADRIRQVLADPAILAAWRAAIPSLLPMEQHVRNLSRIYAGAVRHGREAAPPDPAVTAARLASLSRRLESRSQALEEARALAERRGAELLGKQRDLEGYARSIEQHASLLASRSAAIAELERAAGAHAAAVGRLRDAVLSAEAEAAAANAKAASADSEIARREEALRAKDATIAAFEQSVEQHRAEIGRREEALEAKAATIAAFERSVEQHRAAIARKDADLAAFQKSTSELRGALARVEAELRNAAAERAKAERAWNATVEEHRASIRLHAEALAARERDVASAREGLGVAQAALEAEKLRADAAIGEARAASSEVEALQALSSAAGEARARSEAEGRALGVARAEAERTAAGWRERARKAESGRAAAEAALAATTASLGASGIACEELRARIDRLEDEARRVDELAARGAAALAVPRRDDGDRVAAAADLAGTIEAQQARIADLRSWARARNGSERVGELVRRLDALPRRLRVLLVIHDFLPYHAAGSELYTYQLAKALSVRHDVELIFCENRPERPQYEARRGCHDGLPFTEIVHHAAFPDFRATYSDAAMEACFDAVLDRFAPDVVHVQHTKFFGVGILGRAARRGIPVVYTLHEYMLLCARDGQMVRADGTRCALPEAETCGACMAAKLVEARTLSTAVQALGRGLARILPSPAKEIGTRAARRAAVRHGTPVAPGKRASMIDERARVIREALGRVDLFLAPSEFLRRTFVDAGFVRADRVMVSRYGQDLSRFRGPPSCRSGPLRVGYLGTIAAYKGVHVLVDALNRLAAQDVEGRIHGVTEFFPDYVRELEARITNPRVRVLGRYENGDVGRILSEMDVLVVPSLWWENSPITIHEAFLAGVPVVAGDQGGMAELVQDGVNGFHFKIGDAADLARVLMRFVGDRDLVERLRPRREIVRDIREDALWTEGHYRRLIAARAGRR